MLHQYGIAGCQLVDKHLHAPSNAWSLESQTLREKGYCNQNVSPQNPLKILHQNLSLSETHTFFFLKLLKTEFTLVFYKDSAPTEETTRCAATLKKHRSMFYREIMADYCENRMQHTNTAWAECRVSVHVQ